MSQGVYKITEQFEEEIARYTGAPYVCCVDSASNALFLCLLYSNVKDIEITIPSHTYMSIPNEIIRAGGKVKFRPSPEILYGEYQLKPTIIWDSALHFTADMFRPGMLQCLSFTGPYKILSISKGGAVLSDDIEFINWARKARFSGRSEMDYHEEKIFNQLGFNMYLLPELAVRGLLMMKHFWDFKGNKIPQEDRAIPYPDLSLSRIYTHPEEYDRCSYWKNL